jgi:hypothetical protein
MSEPRYTAGSVTGFPISGSSGHCSGRKPSTIAYVYDSAYCYRIIKEFPSFARYGPKESRLTPLQAAQAFADRLNAGELPAAPKPLKRKRRRRRLKRKPQTVRPSFGHFTEYQGFVLYVIPQWIFVYDDDKNLHATVTSMRAARLVVQRLRRAKRRET